MTLVDTTDETTRPAETTALAIGQDPLARMAERYGTTRDSLRRVCDTVCFKPDREGNTPPPELRLAFYLVCEAHGLNPLKREIFALYDAKKNQLMPYVSIDGWLRKANEHPDYDGMEVTIDGHAEGKFKNGSVFRHPTGATCKIWRKGQSRPVVWQESWDENFQANQYESGTWYNRPERMMKWKATIQCIRVAFHLSGVMDEQEAIEAMDAPVRQLTDREEGADRCRANLENAVKAKAARDGEATDAVVVAETPTEPPAEPQPLLPTIVTVFPVSARRGVTNDKKKNPYLIVQTTDRDTFRVFRTTLFEQVEKAIADQSGLQVTIEKNAITEIHP